MLDRDIIQSVGARNVRDDDGRITGFRFEIRMPNYRGVWGSLIDGVAVAAGGLEWGRDETMWTLQGRTFTAQELRESDRSVRWQLDEPAVITVPHEGGLPAGVHELRVDIAIHAPYIPAEFQPSVFHAEREVVFVS